MGDGLGFRRNIFDGVISISALQWLCYPSKRHRHKGKSGNSKNIKSGAVKINKQRQNKKKKKGKGKNGQANNIIPHSVEQRVTRFFRKSIIHILCIPHDQTSNASFYAFAMLQRDFAHLSA